MGRTRSGCSVAIIGRPTMWIVCPCGFNAQISRAETACPACGGTAWRRETEAEALHRLRAAAVAAGKCYTCRKRAPKPGRRNCQVCIGNSRVARLATRGNGKCDRCGIDVSARATRLCESCTRKVTVTSRAAREKAIADGLCGRCHKNPLEPGRTACAVCLADLAARAREQARAAGAIPKPCTVCLRSGFGAYDHSSRTHDRWAYEAIAVNDPGDSCGVVENRNG